MHRTYLDWAAAAPASAHARRAFFRALKDFGNPSSPHVEGRVARSVLEDARTRIARLAGTKPDAVIFTSGATEANALAMAGQVRALLKDARAPGSIHVLYSPAAHASTRGAARMLEAEGIIAEPIPFAGGRIDMDALSSRIRPETALVALDAVCGETGTRFDVRGVRRVLDAARKGGGARIRLHADASQLPCIGPFDLVRLGADTVSLDAQKVGGVRGIGCLIAPRQANIAPLMEGGGQERGLRPGTEGNALAAAFACALEEAREDAAHFSARAGEARARLLGAMARAVPDVVPNEGREQAPHILNVSLPGRDTDYLLALLDEAGFAVSARSACATDDEGSAAVLALTGDPERARSTLRVSWGPRTRPRDLARFARAFADTVRFLDANPV